MLTFVTSLVAALTGVIDGRSVKVTMKRCMRPMWFSIFSPKWAIDFPPKQRIASNWHNWKKKEQNTSRKVKCVYLSLFNAKFMRQWTKLLPLIWERKKKAYIKASAWLLLKMAHNLLKCNVIPQLIAWSVFVLPCYSFKVSLVFRVKSFCQNGDWKIIIIIDLVRIVTLWFILYMVALSHQLICIEASVGADTCCLRGSIPFGGKLLATKGTFL